jgi:hypothetical protein
MTLIIKMDPPSPDPFSREEQSIEKDIVVVVVDVDVDVDVAAVASAHLV